MSEHKEHKILRRTVTIANNLAVYNWNVNLAIGFQPDEVIVRQVTYYDTNDNGTIFLCSNLVTGDGVLCTFTNPCAVAPQSTFQITHQIGGDTNFRIMYLSNDVLAPLTVLSGDLAVTLEFTKRA
jgi:hypothetical protein